MTDRASESGPASEALRVVALEDDRFARKGMESDLRDGGVDARVIGDETRFLPLVEAHAPHVVLIDLLLHSKDAEYRGLEYIRRVKERWPNIKCVVLTGFKVPLNLRSAVQAGADGFVVKDAVVDCADLVRRIARGDPFWDQALLKESLSDRDSIPGDEGRLTSRELDVLRELALDRTNEEIGKALAISVETVRVHLKAIFRKLNVSNRRDAVLKARTKGYLHPPATRG
jgi:two-component system response regulator DesR